MPSELMSEYGPKLMVAILGVGLALVCLVGILWIVRGRRGPSPFVRGGRNRQPRLQVLDAAAVDARRRLVLVRRDDVEHLIMIGGPTDVVIESRIAHSDRGAETASREVQSAAIPVAAMPTPSKTVAAETVRHPAPRSEVIREPMTEVTARETRAPAAPQPVAAPPVAIPPAAVPRMEPAIASQPANPARMEPVAPQPRVETPVATQPALDDAARLLDSQRDRVFAERSTASAATVATARPAPQPVPASIEKPTGLGSDFEKILEEEMANNMAARETSLSNRTSRPLPQAGPAVAIPVVAAPGNAKRDEPSLQSEVARIFGEMSASRDK